MTNHPGRPKPGSAQPLRMTPQQLRDIRERSGLTQQQIAELAGVAVRTLQQYEAGDRAIPLSASGLLCLSLAVLGAPAGLMAPWVQPGVIQALETRWAKRRTREAMAGAISLSPAGRSRAVGDPGALAPPSGG